jgi:hypothetical protein
MNRRILRNIIVVAALSLGSMLGINAATPTTSTPARTTAAPAKPTKKKIVITKPDLKQIRDTVLNPKSPFYFPKLQKKYEVNDTNTMTDEEFRHFYLGYMFQEDYDPYRVSPFSDMTLDRHYYQVCRAGTARQPVRPAPDVLPGSCAEGAQKGYARQDLGVSSGAPPGGYQEHR